MGKSLIYAVNTTSSAVAVGSTVPLGSVVRKYGNSISLSGATVNLRDPGYYDVDFSATFTAAATGDVTFALYQDGVAVPGATSTVTIGTADTQYESTGFDSTVRVKCCGNSGLTVVALSAAPTISSCTLRVKTS